ncbi:hypothetical protein lerEdw1_020376 [Lerista edwardsae]|nr:hypothetical protein lerEdw1_020376 [Lerista edwardsae]
MWPSVFAVGALLSLLAWADAGPLPHTPKVASIFSDLTPAELQAVRDFLVSRPELGLQPGQGESLAKNSLFLVELLAPKKSQALRFLDAGGHPPQAPGSSRGALWCWGHTEHHRIRARPMSQQEYDLLYGRLATLLAPLREFLQDVSGFGLEDCGERCLAATEVSPRGLAPGERRTWLILQRFVEGYFLHPVGLEVLVDHSKLDPQRWTVQKLWYNGQYYDSPEELAERYKQREVTVVRLPPHPEHSLFSTFVPRGHFAAGPPTNVQGAKVCEPHGHRYSVRGNLLEYSGWSLAFRLRSSTGMQLFDVRFNGERVAYEVSVQEAIAFYGGNSPATMQTKYIDVGWGMGSTTHELAPGVDCPEVATFLDAYHYYDADGPMHYPRAICIFELPTGVPTRRHFDNNFNGGSHFYAGLEGHALVLRTTSTVYNYDYIWDFLFYPNGVLEAKVHATGYVHASFYTPEGIRYGTRLQANLLGNIHTHLVHYKVDLDIAGAGNSFETMDVALENISLPWTADQWLVQPRLERKSYLQERQATFPMGRPLPRYFLFNSPSQKNRWGHQRSYRIQLNSHADRVLPRNWKEEKGITWSRYHLAVTQHHENEDTSSSLYTQNNPWEPTVNFENFVRNNENLENQDLVAWVTVGFLHIPHSEDIPNTSTPGNVVGFYLRPFNFFDEDPSVASRRTIIVRPGEPGTKEGVQIQRWTPSSPDPCITGEPFSYNGTYGQV